MKSEQNNTKNQMTNLTPCPLSIKQGISGRVWWREGDFMPSIGETPIANSPKPIKRQLVIYKVVNESQTTKVERFYTQIKAPIVKMLETDANGCFEIALEAGTYSLFSAEEQGYYANLFDGEMNICPIKVEAGKVTTIDFQIDYKATH